MKNDLILFAAMFVVAWFGFSMVSERFGSKKAASAPPTNGNALSQGLVAGVGNGAVPALVSSHTDQSTSPMDTGEQQIKAMLKNRVDAWNDRSLERYMADYRKFESLSINFKGEARKDWLPVYNHLKSVFGPSMGTLRINNIQIDMVGSEAAVVGANWNLQQRNKVTNGRMNLVLNKVEAVWQIITENLIEN